MKPDVRGTFGDMFGAIYALFSGLAFPGLIVTLIMQHEELGLQLKELAQANEELATQREVFAEQTKTMKIQRFENTLFNIFSLQQGIVDGLEFQKMGLIIRQNQRENTFLIFLQYYYNTISIWTRVKCIWC